MVQPGGTLKGSTGMCRSQDSLFMPFFSVTETHYFKLFFSSRSRPHLHYSSIFFFFFDFGYISAPNTHIHTLKFQAKQTNKNKNNNKKNRFVYPTLTWAAHTYQKCVWISPGGIAGKKIKIKQKQKKKNICRLKNWLSRRTSYISNMSVPPGLAISLTTRLPCTHYSPLQNHQTVANGSRVMHKPSFALCCDSLCHFLPRFTK